MHKMTVISIHVFYFILLLRNILVPVLRFVRPIPVQDLNLVLLVFQGATFAFILCKELRAKLVFVVRTHTIKRAHHIGCGGAGVKE